jgi:putative ABC transport system substrate-binding protein
VDAFLGALRDLGYVEGQTIAIEWRFAPAGGVNDAAVHAELAAELVRLPVDVIVSLSSTSATLAAKAATSTIPIVATASVPVESGLVASLARPSGNVTGVSGAVGENAKHLDLLRSVVPGLTRAAALFDVANPANAPQWDEFRQAAETAGVQAQRIDLYSTSDLERAFDVAELGGAQALSVIAQVLLTPVRKRVVELALQHRLPSIGRQGEWAEAGLLMTYGANFLALVRRAAVYVDKILRGARPADLPIEQPNVFDFVINLKTAQALGLTIPPDVAAQVTQWIQ